MSRKKKNIILFVGLISRTTVAAVRQYEKKTKQSLRIAVIFDSKKTKHVRISKRVDDIDIKIPCNLKSTIATQKALAPIQDEILAITCRGEEKIPLFHDLIAHTPYLLTPTAESLNWSTDKLMMRRRLYVYDKSITPAYKVVKDSNPDTLEAIEKKVGFPLVMKPSGLAASRLVSICYHQEELEKVIKRAFKKIKALHKKTSGRGEPKLLVEQFMEGEMYSVDAYVNARGTVSFCPMVHVKTGKSIGFDDFFGYQQMTPTLLKAPSIESAHETTKKGVHALGLRNTTAHVELLKTEDGWKIIEIGPRVGGFRPELYEHSFGINHTMNDILVRAGKSPMIPKKVQGYSAAMKFFAKKEGRLVRIKGIKKIQSLKSLKTLRINKKAGDMCTFAKNGGSSVFNIILFNKKRSELLADIRRLESTIDIQIKKAGS